jgi:hypothetical protein
MLAAGPRPTPPDPAALVPGARVRILALGIPDPPLEVGQEHVVRDVLRVDHEGETRVYVDLEDLYDCHLSSLYDRWVVVEAGAAPRARCEDCGLEYGLAEDGDPRTDKPYTCDDCGGAVG